MAAARRKKAKASKRKTAKKKAAQKATNVDRLRKAGALKVSITKLSAKHHDVLNKLSKAEVAALIKVSKKMGGVRAPAKASKAWLV